MRHLRHALPLVAAAALVAAGLAVPAQAIADRDCGDFSTQRQAQNFFVSQGGPRRDPHRLDADGDGKACDSLPCPCGATTKPKPKPATGSGSGSGGTVRQRGNVVKVVDGDTVRVRMAGRRTTRDVRLIGIDTPEVYGGRECYGPEASAALKRLLPVGTRVRLVSDRTQARTDRYGRLLRYVSKGDLDVNRRQVATGAAEVYVYGGEPFLRTKSYRQAQKAARDARRGLWGACRS